MTPLLDLPSPKPDFSFEDAFDGPVCGIDEVGRGPLAGPVVAAAVVIRRNEMPPEVLAGINDSKQLTAKKRSELFSEIRKFSYVSVAEVSVEDIDRLNILRATLLAMKIAHAALKETMPMPPVAALVDGNQPPDLGGGRLKIKTIVQGDARSFSIAAASIIAKHHRDELMISYAKEFPHYGWQTNAGYGTKEHLKALEIHGVTRLHRRSFAPISKLLVKENSAND